MTDKQPHSPGIMDRDHVWQAIYTQRLSLVDLLEELSDEEWRQPSLCDGWTVRDVAAHLTLQQVGPGAAIGMIIRARGNTDRAIHDAACRRAAALPTEQIIAEIRGMVGSRRHNFGVTYRETLIDILVHGQDIAIPLGRRHNTPPEAAAVAASRVWTMRWPPPFPAKRTMDGFRLTATDTSWSVGEGPEVQAPMSAILLLSAGRLAALPQLSGEGAPDLTARLSAPLPCSTSPYQLKEALCPPDNHCGPKHAGGLAGRDHGRPHARHHSRVSAYHRGGRRSDRPAVAPRAAA
jgi:uncharacterized protein (TIGR03083 family)